MTRAGNESGDPGGMAETTELRRSLGLPLLVFYGTGTILGLGIYVLLGEVAGAAGMLAPLAFVLAAVIATFTGLSYGELSSRIPKSAGEVNYAHEAFGRRWLSSSIGWLIVISALVSTATVVNGYVGYVHEFVEMPRWLVICLITGLLGGIAAWGITQSAVTITVITLVEVLGLFVVIALAADNLAELPARWRELLPGAGDRGPGTEAAMLTAGSFIALFTFIGFEDMVNVAEESRNPERDMPRAIVISLVILTVLYVVVATIAVLGLAPEELAESDAPLADILRRKGEHYPEIISGIGLIAIVNGVLVQLVMGSRVLYGMAEKRMAPRAFRRVHPRTRTPLLATGLVTGAVLVLALSFDLGQLARATNYVLLAVFAVVNLSLWRIKRRDPAPAHGRTWPIAVPIIGFILSVGAFVAQLVRTL